MPGRPPQNTAVFTANVFAVDDSAAILDVSLEESRDTDWDFVEFSRQFRTRGDVL